MRTFVDGVAINITSSGTVPFQLGAAVAGGYRGTEALVDANTYTYIVQQGNNRELGFGTYSAESNTLTRQVLFSSYGNGLVPFQVNATVKFTLCAADIADIIAAASGTDNAAAASATAYGLQWAIWFNSAPQADELLGLYVSPFTFAYPANFSTSAKAPPVVLPTAQVVLNIDRQVGGIGAWNTIGTITIPPSGIVSLQTTGGVQITINQGDRLRVIAPDTPDATIAGLAVTLKGLIPSS